MVRFMKPILATTTVHGLDREERHHLTILAVKFHGQPPPDAPRSGRRTRRQPPPWMARFCHFPAISGRPIPLSHLLYPLNSFLWSFSPDSSPFERYDKNKFGRLLDRVFRQPHQPLDQGEGTDVFLVSWAFH